ncbi:MAG: peptide chain release factor N(5)-glutamine methyltransferase [Candidatus Krumholzibacteria bacterium]|nr:peptide chain release factor N(5)-glutamine methyltransferase [Candidatus Krumholzibacteria bacterium]
MASTPTVMEAVRLSEGYLQKHGVESPRLSAEHLLARALDCSRLDLYLRFEENLEEKILKRYRKDLKIRASHYPLQYILGETEFFSLPFGMSEGVFIPRPETELLVEAVEKKMESKEKADFMEIGTGSGIISGTLAKRHPEWRGVTFDISPAAAFLARKNFMALGVDDRLEILIADGFDAIRGDARFDILVSNPPYIPTGDIEGLQEEVSLFESRAALDGGPDGLSFYPMITVQGGSFLRPGGLVALEVGEGQATDVGNIFRNEGYEEIEIWKDYNNKERVVTARKQ